ncbi:DNA polymerase III subunit psi [Moellerella wisconsensis]|nr:DNA polymerase III subunit psi [Moellerella wisconsensis]UNH23777.1 DNA polymerase III subunit psi [Moellerella wisconsensis]UNH26865.1 DNA polymerase III subunit psi [Moellerella wisconsensis]UNH30349.1 DNA polymerase III subunit psi [Moellerella wisconsensis]UNH38508.1 DNA polymerase III subunit psi [Moellerella wisconsensis]UNH42024.1 DNA polymerase III subunit psi [Moellerella wisconsensis]
MAGTTRMTRRDKLLKSMGITQWILRHPSALKGERGVNIPESAKLIIIADDGIDLNNQLLKDIFQAIKIDKTDIVCIDSEQLDMLPSPVSVPCWVCGDSRIPETKSALITSPALAKLSISSEAKRSLWKQIYQNDENFNVKTI